jgi:hypothetical protein
MNQRWKIVYVDDDEPEPKKGELNKDFGLYVERPFHVSTKLPSGRYLDTIGNNIVIKTPNGFNTQQWYFDQKTRTIKSVGNAGKSWDIKNAGKSNNLQVWNTNSGWFQFFKYEVENFVNIHSGKVLDVAGGKDAEGQNVIVWKRHNGNNQKWTITYVDSVKIDTNEDFTGTWGFTANKPFYLRSKLPSRRVMEVTGGRNLVLKRARKDQEQQQFFFDSTTKTIKSQKFKEKSLDIQGGGSTKNMQIWKTNARWFQLFKFEGEYLTNEKGLVLEVQGNKDAENTNLIVGSKNGGKN